MIKAAKDGDVHRSNKLATREKLAEELNQNIRTQFADYQMLKEFLLLCILAFLQALNARVQKHDMICLHTKRGLHTDQACIEPDSITGSSHVEKDSSSFLK
jgi:hypothetical protein